MSQIKLDEAAAITAALAADPEFLGPQIERKSNGRYRPDHAGNSRRPRDRVAPEPLVAKSTQDAAIWLWTYHRDRLDGFIAGRPLVRKWIEAWILKHDAR